MSDIRHDVLAFVPDNARIELFFLLGDLNSNRSVVLEEALILQYVTADGEY